MEKNAPIGEKAFTFHGSFLSYRPSFLLFCLISHSWCIWILQFLKCELPVSNPIKWFYLVKVTDAFLSQMQIFLPPLLILIIFISVPIFILAFRFWQKIFEIENTTELLHLEALKQTKYIKHHINGFISVYAYA